MNTYELTNLTFAESTLAKFKDLSTYMKTGRGHGPVETPKGKVVRASGDGQLRGAGLSVFVARVAARGLCVPRPEAFFARLHRPAIRPASMVHRKICAEEVFENEHLHKMGGGGNSRIFTERGSDGGLETPYQGFEPRPIRARSYRPTVWQYPSQSNACEAVRRSHSGILLHSASPLRLPHD
jgi:hypothetical protein